MSSRRAALPFLLPALCLSAVVTIYPVVYAFWLSLHRRLLIFGVNRFSGLENYRFMVTDDRFYNALVNTLYFTTLSVGLELVLGLFAGVLLNRDFPFRNLARGAVLVPWAVPTVVSAKLWEWMYQPDGGIINWLLHTSGNWLADPFRALNAAVIMDVWKTTPFVTMLLLGGLQTIPRELYQAARVDGAGEWQIFSRITLPLLAPVILLTVIFRALDAFRVFDAVYVLTGGGPANTTETLSIYAYKILFQTLEFGYGSALALVVFLCTGLMTILFLRLARRSGP